MLNTNHYYGDIVRKLFLAGAALMLVALPFFQSLIPFSLSVSIFAALVIVLCAGLIAPTQKWITALNMLVAAGAIGIFEYYAATAYIATHIAFFTVTQILAIIFLAAFYYSVKTVRGTFLD